MGRFSNARHIWSTVQAAAGQWTATIPLNRIMNEVGQVWVKPNSATAFTLQIIDQDGATIYDSGNQTEEFLEHLSAFSFNGTHSVKLVSVSPATGTFDFVRVVYR